MGNENKCPKCGGTEFIAEVDLGVTVSSDKNVGQLKFNMIKKVVCADIKCRHVLESGSLRDSMVSKTKTLLEALKGKPIHVK